MIAPLYIVIPVHDRRELTRACLLALRRQTFHDAVVVVVDDGSTDGTWEMLLGGFPEVVALRSAGELWWTGATNLGCGWVLAHSPEAAAVVTLNDDTEPEPEWLSRLAAAYRQRGPRAIVGSLLVGVEDDLVGGAELHVDWWTARYRTPLRGRTRHDVQALRVDFLPTDLLCGCGTLIPVQALRELGPFDPCLPQYGADYEFSRRAARRGWRLSVSTQAVLPVRRSHTGLHERRDESLAMLARSLVSIRSANSLRYRLHYARRVAPPAALPSYFVCDVARILGGSARDFLASRRP